MIPPNTKSLQQSSTPGEVASERTSSLRERPAVDVRTFLTDLLRRRLELGETGRSLSTEGFRERLSMGDERAAAVLRPTFEFATDDRTLNLVANSVLSSFFDALDHLSQLSEDDLNALALGIGGDDLTELANVWCESLLGRWMSLLADLLLAAGEDPVAYMMQLTNTSRSSGTTASRVTKRSTQR